MKRRHHSALLLLVLLGIALVLAVPPTQAAGPPGTDLGPAQEEPPKGPPGLEWALARLVLKEAGPEAAPPLMGLAAAPEPVMVVVEAVPGQAGTAASSLEAAGGKVESTYGDLVQAVVPVSALEGLTAAPGVRFIRRPFRPMPAAVTSQGVSLVGAATWHQSGLTGRGVKVAIVDVGFKGYTSLLGTELPPTGPGIVIRSFRADGDVNANEPHGTAVAEIVYDVAPEAQLYLVNANTEVELGNAVDWLVTQGVSIVSHSVVWPGSGSGDGTGPVADIVARAQQGGILWVNAAGNEAQSHWGGIWRDDDGDGQLNFTASDETNTVSASAGSTIGVLLTWDDPWGASANDYDLYLYYQQQDGTLNQVASSRNWQSGFQNPIEGLEYSGTSGTYHVKVKRASGTKNSRLSLFVYPQTPEYRESAGSLLPPADSDKALAAGAVSWSSPGTLESFSSRGPTLDGRTKPDLVAPDGVSTATYASFYGTSAATPHVAGAAALVRQLYSGMTPTQLTSFLKGRATDLGDAGPDNLYGWGRLNLGAVAPASVRVTPATAFVSAKASQQFTATGLAADGITPLTGLAFTWSLVDSNAGTITASGLFTAGARAGSYDNAIKASALDVAGYASVTIVPAAIRVTPAAATVQGGAAQQLTATGLTIDLTTPVTNLTFTWSLLLSIAGTIAADPTDSAKATFTAGTRAGTYTSVIKASAQGVDGYASVTVVPASVRVAPATATVQAGASQQFTATGLATDGTTPVTNLTFTWSLLLSIAGTITADPTDSAKATFTASSRAGTYSNVIRASAQGVDGFASVTIPRVYLRLVPASRDVLAYDIFQLTVEVDATETSVQEVAAFIDFDPARLGVLYTQPGPGMGDVVTSQWENDRGTIDYVATGPSQSGVFTLITFTLLSKGPTGGTALAFSGQPPRGTYALSSGLPVLLSTSGSQVAAWNLPVASFEAAPDQGLAPLTVQFTDRSWGTVTGWSWDFGDGITSNQQNPTHTYARMGDYTVSLTVSNPGAWDSRSQEAYIKVYEPPAADFLAQPTMGDAPLTVQFSNLSTGSISSWLWSFGDGGVGSLANPSHRYVSSGSYTVSLTVSGPAGSSTHQKQAYISASGVGSLEGRVLLQGRSQQVAATVRLGETSVAAQADGRFSFGALAAGYHSVTVTAPGYLAQSRRVQVMSGQATALPPVHLAAGDVDGDGRIDMRDLVAVAGQFNAPATTAPTDFNGDGWVDMRDLALVGLNLGLPG